jgi:hypothetical protein
VSREGLFEFRWVKGGAFRRSCAFLEVSAAGGSATRRGSSFRGIWVARLSYRPYL